MTEQSSRATAGSPLETVGPNPDPACDIINHHLRLFGIRERAPLVWRRPDENAVASARAACAAGQIVVALDPDSRFCCAFDASVHEAIAAPGDALACPAAAGQSWRRLRTLHPVRGFMHTNGVPGVTTNGSPAAAWLWIPHGRSGVLLVGTDLAADLIRYRQGDPSRALDRPTEALWGIPGERPNYLFEGQLTGEDPQERPADWWVMALATTLEQLGGLKRSPMLPGDAPGAIVITGDDDQARLSHYAMQLEALGDLPITYFLHPLTKHTRASMAELFAGRRVDLGLHPDALDAPERYSSLLVEQAAWYSGLTGAAPQSVRNHGFLNDGYWGHLPHWRAQGIRISSNIPGLDGRVLNGSLLPARMSWGGVLTEHWSLLTAIGDGIVFILGLTPEQSAASIHGMADRVRASNVPGLIVLNLHPDNIEATIAMHHAVREVVASGFLAWTMRDCLEWFETVDLGSNRYVRPGGRGD
jgi:hypothetical protein